MRKTIMMTGVLLLLFLAVPCGAQFGPGPDEDFIKAERAWLTKQRKDLGDQRFVAFVIAKLNLLTDCTKPNDPRYKVRKQQLGTAEYFDTMRPYFIEHALPMLIEMKSDEALPVLTDLLRLYEHWYKNRPRHYHRLGMGLNGNYAAISKAWFEIAIQTRDQEEVIAQYAELTSELEAYQRLVAYGYSQPEDKQFLFLDFDARDPEENNLLIRFAKSPTHQPGSGTGHSLILSVARRGDWYIPEQARQQYLNHEDMRIRLAVVGIDYTHAIVNQGLNQKPGGPLDQLDRLEGAGLELDTAHRARLQVYRLWRELLKERKAMHGNPPPVVPGGLQHDKAHREYQWRLEKLDSYINKLSNLVSEPNQLDPDFVDLLIETLPYNRSFALMLSGWRGKEIKLAETHHRAMARILQDPWVANDIRRYTAETLYQHDYRPAADAIYQVLNELRLLDGYAYHPQVIMSASSPFSLDLIQWLKEHRQEAR